MQLRYLMLSKLAHLRFVRLFYRTKITSVKVILRRQAL